MSDSQNPEQKLQSILKDISVGGNLTTGDISQILNLFVIVHQPNTFIPKSTPYNIPSSNTIKFVGRADALEQLHQALQQDSQVAITAIEGMGGVGKTELATQYCLLHLLLNTYPGGICWLRARDEDISIQILRFAEAKLGIKPPEDWNIKDRVDFCWSRWQEKKEGNVLIVLDDVNDYPKIQLYLPPQLSQFKVLITTRLQLDLPQSFSLDILSEYASLELLRQWIGEEKVNEELAEAKELCLRLGYLPLALNLIGRYVQKRKISVAEMLRRLEEKGLQHQAFGVNKKDRTRTLNIQRGVTAAFELSWEELSEDARKLGCLLSLFAVAPIPWDLVEQIETGLDREKLEDTRVELENLYLLQTQEEDNYKLHQLIREFIQSKLEALKEKKELKTAFSKTIAIAAKTIPNCYSITYQSSLKFSNLITHLQELTQNLSQYLDEKIFNIPFTRLGYFYESQSLYDEAQQLHRICLSISEQLFGKKHANYATSLNNLGYIYQSIGQYSESEALLKEALSLRRELCKRDSNIAQSLNNLATVYRKQGFYLKAQPLLFEALELRKKSLGSKNIKVAMSLDHLARFYHEQEYYCQAEQNYKQALDVCETYKQNNQQNHLFHATILYNLGTLYTKIDEFSNAERCFLYSKDIIQELLPKDHLDLAKLLNALANLYEAQSLYIKAKPLYIEAHSIYTGKLGSSSSQANKVKESLLTCLKQAITTNQANLETLRDDPSCLIQSIIEEVQTSSNGLQ